MKKILCGLWMLLVLCCVCGALAGCRYRYSDETDPQKYLSFERLEDGTYAVTGFSDRKVKDLVIPAEHDGKRVTKVAENAFYEDLYWNPDRGAVQTLTIEEGVREIGEEAFYGCRFARMSLPDSIEIVGSEAFYEVPASFILPASLHTADESAFLGSGLYGDLDLNGVTFGEYAFSDTDVRSAEISSDVPDGAFYCCENLSSLTLKEGVGKIGDSAFRGTAAEKVIFPASLTSIGASAFAESGLTEAALSGQLGSQAFANCIALQKVTLSGNMSFGGSVFQDCTALDTLLFSDFSSPFDAEIFQGCPLGSIATEGDCGEYFIKDGCLTSRTDDMRLLLGGSHAFDISGWKEIGDYAFAGRKLGTVRTGGELKTIAHGAFCRAEIGEMYVGCDLIETNAFAYAKFGKIRICAAEIASEAFKSATFYDGTVFLEEGCRIVRESAFSKCDILTLRLPASLERAETWAFYSVSAVYYDLREGTPIPLDTSVFCNIISVREQGGRYIEFSLPENFRFYVHAALYDACKAEWDARPVFTVKNQTYVYRESLSDYLVAV